MTEDRSNAVSEQPEGYGPDQYGRRWDYDYTETEFLACIMEVGPMKRSRRWLQITVHEYWFSVDRWFERHYPERCTHGLPEPTPNVINKGQLGFKVALWNWLGEHDEQAKQNTEAFAPHVQIDTG